MLFSPDSLNKFYRNLMFPSNDGKKIEKYRPFPSQNELLLFSCYLAVPGSSYLPFLWQFFSNPISPLMQISHLHKGIPKLAVNSSSLASPVL